MLPVHAHHSSQSWFLLSGGPNQGHALGPLIYSILSDAGYVAVHDTECVAIYNFFSTSKETAQWSKQSIEKKASYITQSKNW